MQNGDVKVLGWLRSEAVQAADVDESLLAALPELTYCRHFFCKAWGVVLGRARGMALVILS